MNDGDTDDALCNYDFPKFVFYPKCSCAPIFLRNVGELLLYSELLSVTKSIIEPLRI